VVVLCAPVVFWIATVTIVVIVVRKVVVVVEVTQLVYLYILWDLSRAYLAGVQSAIISRV
jgi:hypothetical protein